VVELDNKIALAEKMRDLAVSGHPRASELVEKALAFTIAIDGFYSEPQTVTVKAFMGAWARARLLWCECTGESLI
jgi:hypothetical protein